METIAVLQRKCRLQQSDVQHQVWSVYRMMWAWKCTNVLGTRRLYVLGTFSSLLKTWNNFFRYLLILMVIVILIFDLLKMAKENKTTLPSAGLFIIRYHSFYREYWEHGTSDWLQHLILYLCNRFLFFQLCTGAKLINTYWMLRMNENLKWLKIFK